MSFTKSFVFIETPGKMPSLEVIDQRKLPLQEVKIILRTFEEIKAAIQNMTVRGAPLIGICAAFAMAIAGVTGEDLDTCKRSMDSTRPTAVNLMYATNRMVIFGKKSKENRLNMFEEAKRIADDELAASEKMAEFGSRLIPSRPREGETTVKVIHHCNTGGLATYGPGTALGAIIHRYQSNSNLFVWVDETRPRLQGSKLTSWELNNLKVPNKIIVDSASGSILFNGQADCVLFGADRIVANGDVVNKIGSYSLSVLAKENGVPVYCVAPTSTIDLSIQHGLSVKIEERDESEILEFPEGNKFVDESSRAYNPAFDVTPFRYITAIVTEEGICYPPFVESLAAAKARAIAKHQNKGGVETHEIERAMEVFTITPKSTTSSSSSIFGESTDVALPKKKAVREDHRPTKPKTYMGDGSEDPKVQTGVIREPPRFAANKTYLGDGSENPSNDSSTVSSVRQFAEIKKSTIVLTDTADSSNESVKSSIRIVNKTGRGNGVFERQGEDMTRKEKTHFEPHLVDPTPSKDKAHIEPHLSNKEPVTRKGFIEVPSGEARAPQSKGHREPKLPEKELDLSKLAKGSIAPSPEKPAIPQGKGFPASPVKSQIFG